MSQISGIPEGYGRINLDATDVVTPYANNMLAAANAQDAQTPKEYPFNPNYDATKSELFGDLHAGWIMGENSRVFGNDVLSEMQDGRVATNYAKSAFKNAIGADKMAEAQWRKGIDLVNKDPLKYGTIENIHQLNRFEAFARSMYDWDLVKGKGVVYRYTPQQMQQLQEVFPDDPIFEKAQMNEGTGLYEFSASDIRLNQQFQMQIKQAPDDTTKSIATRLEPITTGSITENINEGETKEYYAITTEGKTTRYVSKDRVTVETANTLFSGVEFIDAIKDGVIDDKERELISSVGNIKLSAAGLGIYEEHFASQYGNRAFSSLSIEEKTKVAEDMLNFEQNRVVNNLGSYTMIRKTGKSPVGSDFKPEKSLSPAQQDGELNEIKNAESVPITKFGETGEGTRANVVGSVMTHNVKIPIEGSVFGTTKPVYVYAVYKLEDGGYAAMVSYSSDLVANITYDGNPENELATRQQIMGQLPKNQVSWVRIDARGMGQVAEQLGRSGGWVEINGEKRLIKTAQDLEEYLSSQKNSGDVDLSEY